MISVIVPNYNHAPYLRQRIKSILNQTYQDFELILLDDCSTDNSIEILSEYSKHPKVSQTVFNDQNSGSTFKQWNKGVELAQGEYIWIAESDDWAEPEFLESLMHEFEQRPNVGLAYVASKVADGDGNMTYSNEIDNTGEAIAYTSKFYIEKFLSVDNSIWNASMMMFKRELFPTVEQQQLYSTMKYCGDWFFYLLVAEKGFDILEVKQTLNNFRVHKNNVSNNAKTAGLTFLEGLDIYSYLKPKLSVKNVLLTSKDWAKKYCKSKRRQYYSKETQQKIIEKMKENHTLMWTFIPFFDIYYQFKFNRNLLSIE